MKYWKKEKYTEGMKLNNERYAERMKTKICWIKKKKRDEWKSENRKNLWKKIAAK